LEMSDVKNTLFKVNVFLTTDYLKQRKKINGERMSLIETINQVIESSFT